VSQTVLFIFEIVGTVAFAISGAMTGLAKKMDIFGIAILGLTTAVGGGIIRDVILGNTPPATFRDPTYAAVALLVSVLVFVPVVRRLMETKKLIFDTILLVMDSLGLGLFTVVGIQIAHTVSDSYGRFLLVFVGVITGVGGGMLRDIFAGDTPYVFKKHVYATASIVGAIVCVMVWDLLGETVSMLIGAIVVLVIRLCAAKYHWNLPKPE
jgi:uncharacterized membrane protein YeiH